MSSTRPNTFANRPGAKNIARSDTYTLQYDCENCGAFVDLTFKKGTPAPIHPDERCEVCGCQTLWKTAKP